MRNQTNQKEEFDPKKTEGSFSSLNLELKNLSEQYFKLKQRGDKLASDQLATEEGIEKLQRIFDSKFKSQTTAELDPDSEESKSQALSQQTLQRSLLNPTASLNRIVEERTKITKQIHELEFLIENKQEALDRIIAVSELSENSMRSEVSTETLKKVGEAKSDQDESSERESIKDLQVKLKEENENNQQVFQELQSVTQGLTALEKSAAASLSNLDPQLEHDHSGVQTSVALYERNLQLEMQLSLAQKSLEETSQLLREKENQLRELPVSLSGINYNVENQGHSSQQNPTENEQLTSRIVNLLNEINVLNQKNEKLEDALKLQNQEILQKTEEIAELKEVIVGAVGAFEMIFPEGDNSQNPNGATTAVEKMSKGFEKCFLLMRYVINLEKRKDKDATEIASLKKTIKQLKEYHHHQHIERSKTDKSFEEESREGLNNLSKELHDLKELNQSIFQHVVSNSPPKVSGKIMPRKDALEPIGKNVLAFLRISKETQLDMMNRVNFYLNEAKQRTQGIMSVKVDFNDPKELMMLATRIVTDLDHIKTEIASFVKSESQQKNLLEQQIQSSINAEQNPKHTKNTLSTSTTKDTEVSYQKKTAEVQTPNHKQPPSRPAESSSSKQDELISMIKLMVKKKKSGEKETLQVQKSPKRSSKGLSKIVRDFPSFKSPQHRDNRSPKPFYNNVTNTSFSFNKFPNETEATMLSSPSSQSKVSKRSRGKIFRVL